MGEYHFHILQNLYGRLVHYIFPSTCLASNSKLLVVDPTLLEDQIREGDMTITMNIHKEICALSKAGGIPLEMEQVIRCSKIAIVKVIETTEKIQKALADDRQKR